MSEIYEVLFTTPAFDLDPEVDKIIRFPWIDEDDNPYTEVLEVNSIDYEGEYVIVLGYSETLNSNDEFHIHESTEVEVLGG